MLLSRPPHRQPFHSHPSCRGRLSWLFFSDTALAMSLFANCSMFIQSSIACLSFEDSIILRLGGLLYYLQQNAENLSWLCFIWNTGANILTLPQPIGKAMLTGWTIIIISSNRSRAPGASVSNARQGPRGLHLIKI